MELKKLCKNAGDIQKKVELQKAHDEIRRLKSIVNHQSGRMARIEAKQYVLQQDQPKYFDLHSELEAALLYFDSAPGDESEKEIILSQIGAALIMLENAITSTSEEDKLEIVSTVVEMARDFDAVKIAETGTNLYGRAA